jgi:hypothetical protein
VEHRQSRYLNNRCENSHRPTRPSPPAGLTILRIKPGCSARRRWKSCV